MNQDMNPQSNLEDEQDEPEIEALVEEEAEAGNEEESENWAEEFTPEEMAELFGGAEKVPAQVLGAAPEVEVIGEEEAEEDDDGDAGERLQKLLARSGVASRRAAEDLIRAGRVSVNNETVTELGRRARPGRDRIAVDGKSLKVLSPGTTVVVLHKPRGCVSTKVDPQNRTTVMAFLPKRLSHLHPVGRLDFDTSGLLLLSDDGDLTHLLLHPSHGVEKRYHARVRGVVSTDVIDRLQKGVRLDDGVTEPCRVRVKAQTPSNALLEIVLREGRNRQIRRMLQAVGHPVSALRRVRLGPLDMGGLPAGAFRELLPGEVHLLKKAARAPKPTLKAARPFAYKPRPSKAQDKSLPSAPQAFARPSAPAPRPSDRSPERPLERPTAPRDSTARPRPPREGASRDDARSRQGASRDDARSRDARSGAARNEGPRSYAPRPARPSGPRHDAPRDGERGAEQRFAPRDFDERGENRRPDSRRPSEAAGQRPSSRPSYPNSRAGNAGHSSNAGRPPFDRDRNTDRSRDVAERRDGRPSAPRPTPRETNGPRDASPRDASSSRPRPPARAAGGAARLARPSGSSGAASGPKNRGGSRLAKRVEDRWNAED